ncbi:MAG: PepSY-associated TM helix domain-containing protein [Opitutales bacterium]|nr:PepSY-associated TM helix domain-containing protein [Opitutales bacterium]
MKAKLRKILFWFHLLTGVVAGSIIAVLCITGVALAFEKELTSWAERGLRRIAVEPDSVPISLDELPMLQDESKSPTGNLELSIHSDPRQGILVSIGREFAHYVDPYSGEVLGQAASSMRTFMDVMLRMHRWLALSGDARNWGRAITGAANAMFFLLALSGLYLWWPRRWNWKNLRPVLLFAGSKGKMRDWNWHHVIGFWTLPVVLVLTFTGMVISYPWLSQRLIQMAGDVERARPDSVALEPDSGGAPVDPDGPVVSGYHDAFRILAEAYPEWQTMQLRKGLPRRRGAPPPYRNGTTGEHGGPAGIAMPFSATIRERGAWPLFSSTQVVLDSHSGRVVQASDYHDMSNGRKLRSWIRFLHTGEALGWPGQLLAGVASAGGVVLVWTGFALAWRRMVASIRRKRKGRVETPDDESCIRG